ncbi:MAG: hypothetical protein A2048_03495 [Deltaproteobacteria bacterium GWA2_45_12]|nr:MAG: hypothetical protein A2048_03495 [Deltaproteobacteria bacterium GWA2_45_12]
MRLLKRTMVQLVGFGVSIAAVFYCYGVARRVDLFQATIEVGWNWMILAAGINFIIIGIKSLRWKMMLQSVGGAPLTEVYKSVLIGYALNNVLPVRGGEVARIHWIGRKASLSYSATTANLVSDRLIEGLSLAFLSLMVFFDSAAPIEIKKGAGVLLLVTIFMYVGLVFLRRLPRGPVWFQDFQKGLHSFMSWSIHLRGICYSLINWIFQVVLIYCVHRSLGIWLPVWSLFLVLFAINIAIIVPSAPGNVGTFEVGGLFIYKFVGLPEDMALITTFVYHAVQVIPVTLAGGMIVLQAVFLDRGALRERGP